MQLAEFVRDHDQRRATLTVVNRDEAAPVYEMLADLFADQSIDVHETETLEVGPSDAVVLEREDGDAAFAVSSLLDLRDTVLTVNSDIYTTGLRGLEEVDTPEVLTRLDEIPFSVTGFPENGQEKLLLIEISRHIEGLAWQADEGTLHTGFQYLSRIVDERGTRRIYRRLGTETDVTTHVYGVPDTRPSIPGVTVRGEDCRELARTWFVVYQSDAQFRDAAALVALQTAPNTWEGYWSYDPDHVAEITRYLDENYAAGGTPP